MKLIIAGSRSLKLTLIDLWSLLIIHKLDGEVLQVISGGARGIDTTADEMARSYGLESLVMNADWETHGNSAGPIRNAAMAQQGDALLLIWDGESRGSANMKRSMEKLNKPIYEIVIKSKEKKK